MGGYDGDGRGGDVGRRDSGEMVAEIRSSDNKQNHKQASCAIKSTEESTQHPREEVQGWYHATDDGLTHIGNFRTIVLIN